MSSGPTPITPGSAGMPLSHEAITTGRNGIRRPATNRRSENSIKDTLETSDREVDGRQPLQQEPSDDTDQGFENGANLDLSG